MPCRFGQLSVCAPMELSSSCLQSIDPKFWELSGLRLNLILFVVQFEVGRAVICFQDFLKIAGWVCSVGLL